MAALQSKLGAAEADLLNSRTTIEQLRAKLTQGVATQEEVNRLQAMLAARDAAVQDEVQRLQAQLAAANAELAQLPMVKATIADFQRTVEATHAQLIAAQEQAATAVREKAAVEEELSREMRKLQSLEASYNVVLREVEAREAETELVRNSLRAAEGRLASAEEELRQIPPLQETVEELKAAVKAHDEERHAVSEAGRLLEKTLNGLDASSVSSSTFTAGQAAVDVLARPVGVQSLAGVQAAAARALRQWAALLQRLESADGEKTRMTEEMSALRDQLVQGASLSAAEVEQAMASQHQELQRRLVFVQRVCLQIDGECEPGGEGERIPQPHATAEGQTDWDLVAAALSQQVARLLTEHRNALRAHAADAEAAAHNAEQIRNMQAEIERILSVAAQNEARAAAATLQLQQEFEKRAADERRAGREEAAQALEQLRLQYEKEVEEQRQMLAEEREHSARQMAVLVDDYSSRIKLLETETQVGAVEAAAAQEERELRCAEVIAILVRAVHGLQHQLYELGAQSTVVRRMLLTGTGSRLHTDMVELVRACSLEASAADGDDDAQWTPPGVSFRSAVIAVMAMHRMQLLASHSWRRYGGTLAVMGPRGWAGGAAAPPIRLWVEAVEPAAVLAALRDRGADADAAAVQLLRSSGGWADGAVSPANSPARRTAPFSPGRREEGRQELVVMLERGLRAVRGGDLARVDRYTSAGRVMDALRAMALGMSEQLCAAADREREEAARRLALEEAVAGYSSRAEEMGQAEAEAALEAERLRSRIASLEEAAAALSAENAKETSEHEEAKRQVLALTRDLAGCANQLAADEERMSLSEEELRRANTRIGRAQEDQAKALAELEAAKAEVLSLRDGMTRAAESGEQAQQRLSADLARAEEEIKRLEQRVAAAAEERTAAAAARAVVEGELAALRQELAVLVGVHGRLEAEKAAAEEASRYAKASRLLSAHGVHSAVCSHRIAQERAAAEQERALAAQSQVTAVAKELEEAAAATARQVQAAQEEGRMLRQKAEAAIVAKEMALNHAAEADREPKQPLPREHSDQQLTLRACRGTGGYAPPVLTGALPLCCTYDRIDNARLTSAAACPVPAARSDSCQLQQQRWGGDEPRYVDPLLPWFYKTNGGSHAAVCGGRSGADGVPVPSAERRPRERWWRRCRRRRWLGGAARRRRVLRPACGREVPDAPGTGQLLRAAAVRRWDGDDDPRWSVHHQTYPDDAVRC